MDPIVRADDLGDEVVDTATGDDVPDGTGGGDPPPPPPPPLDTANGFGSGTIVAQDPTNPAHFASFNLVSTSLGFTSDMTAIDFDANGDPVSGRLAMIVLDNGGTAQAFLLDIDPNGSTATVVDTNLGIFQIPVVADLQANDEVALPAGVNVCQCDFLDWGFWSASGTITHNGINESFDVEHGVWVVAADQSTTGQLSQLANTTATFNGTAIGTFSDTRNGIANELTAGDMQMAWSFGNRQGTIDITSFGGRDLSGNLIGDPNLPGFVGNLSDGALADGVVKGTFVNDGPTIAAGVMGDFFVSDGIWGANGIFIGER
jgi:hypothetical protein